MYTFYSFSEKTDENKYVIFIETFYSQNWRSVVIVDDWYTLLIIHPR